MSSDEVACAYSSAQPCLAPSFAYLLWVCAVAEWCGACHVTINTRIQCLHFLVELRDCK